jgi:hypothetical protein
LQPLHKHVFPNPSRNIPIFHNAILVHVVADFVVGTRDEAFIAI